MPGSKEVSPFYGRRASPRTPRGGRSVGWPGGPRGSPSGEPVLASVDFGRGLEPARPRRVTVCALALRPPEQCAAPELPRREAPDPLRVETARLVRDAGLTSGRSRAGWLSSVLRRIRTVTYRGRRGAAEGGARGGGAALPAEREAEGARLVHFAPGAPLPGPPVPGRREPLAGAAPSAGHAPGADALPGRQPGGAGSDSRVRGAGGPPDPRPRPRPADRGGPALT